MVEWNMWPADLHGNKTSTPDNPQTYREKKRLRLFYGCLLWSESQLKHEIVIPLCKIPIKAWLLCPIDDTGRRVLKTGCGSVPSGALFQTSTGPIGTCCFHSCTYGKQNRVRVQARPIRGLSDSLGILASLFNMVWKSCTFFFFPLPNLYLNST